MSAFTMFVIVLLSESILLFVRVCVPVSDTRVASLSPIVLPPGNVRVLLDD